MLLWIGCFVSLANAAGWHEFENQTDITQSICNTEHAFLECPDGHMVWVKHVLVGNTSHSTENPQSPQCPTPDNTCEISGNDIKRCNTYETCEIGIPGESMTCLSGESTLHNPDFMEISHVCIDVDDLDVADICTEVQMNSTGVTLVSPSWPRSVQQPVHCQCDMVVASNSQIEITPYYVYLAGEFDEFIWQEEDGSTLHINIPPLDLVSELSSQVFFVGNTSMRFHSTGVTGIQEEMFGSKLWIDIKGSIPFQLSCRDTSAVSTSGGKSVFDAITDQVKEYGIPAAVSVLVMALAVLLICVFDKLRRRKKEDRATRTLAATETPPSDENVYVDIPALTLNGTTLPTGQGDIPPSPPRTPRPRSPHGSPASSQRGSLPPPPHRWPEYDNNFARDNYAYAHDHGNNGDQTPSGSRQNTLGRGETSPQPPQEIYLDLFGGDGAGNESDILPSVPRTGSVRHNAYVTGAIRRNESDKVSISDDGYLTPRELL